MTGRDDGDIAPEYPSKIKNLEVLEEMVIPAPVNPTDGAVSTSADPRLKQTARLNDVVRDWSWKGE